jgi:hypothetical protein
VYRKTGRSQRSKRGEMPAKTEVFSKLDSSLPRGHVAPRLPGAAYKGGVKVMAEPGDRSVSVGRVFSRTFGVMGSNPVVVFGFALLLSAIPQLIFNILVRQSAVQIAQTGMSARIVEMGLVGLLVGFVLQAIVSGCITRATVAYSQGQKASIGDCLGVAITRFLPVIAVSLLFGLATMLGFVALFVPGVMLAVMWAVIVPVTVAEDVGVFGAFGRAADLTRGARWKIFGIFLLVILIFFGVSMVIGIVSVLLLGMSYQNPAVATLPIAIVLDLLVAMFNAALISCTQTALFVELREWKDGPMDAKLGAIFE